MSVRLPAAERRDQLLATALETFADKGFHGTSMNEIAEAAGVTKPVLYQHFASKRELYFELLNAVGADLMTRIAAATTDQPPQTQVERAMAAYFRWVSDDHDAFTLLFGSGARRDAEFAEAVRAVERAAADVITPLIAADIDDDHRRVVAYALIGVAEGTSRHLVASGAPFDPDLVAAQVAELAWAGLRGVRRVDRTTAR